MTGTSLGTLYVLITANTADFEKKMHAADRRLEVFSKRWKKRAETMGRIGSKMSLGITAPFAILSSYAIKSLAQFDGAMKQSTAIFMGASASMKQEMADLAEEMSVKWNIAADEAAKGFFYLGSAGLSAEQSLMVYEKALMFAKAGSFDVSTAVDLATDSITSMGMESENTAVYARNLQHVMDVLAKSNIIANATIEQFAAALTRDAGPAAKNLGKDIEETAAILAVFASQGMKTRRAGTRTAVMLSHMSSAAANNAKEWTRAYGKGGIVFDAAGNMRHIADVVKNLEDRIGGLSNEQRILALEQMGFTKESVRSIEMLIGYSDKLRGFDRELQNSTRSVKALADEIMTGLNQAFGQTWQTFLAFTRHVAKLYEPTIRKAAKATKEFFERMKVLPDEKIIKWVNRIAKLAMMGPAIWILSKVIGLLANMSLAWIGVRMSILKAARAISRFGGASGVLPGIGNMVVALIGKFKLLAVVIYSNVGKSIAFLKYQNVHLGGVIKNTVTASIGSFKRLGRKIGFVTKQLWLASFAANTFRGKVAKASLSATFATKLTKVSAMFVSLKGAVLAIGLALKTAFVKSLVFLKPIMMFVGKWLVVLPALLLSAVVALRGLERETKIFSGTWKTVVAVVKWFGSIANSTFNWMYTNIPGVSQTVEGIGKAFQWVKDQVTGLGDELKQFLKAPKLHVQLFINFLDQEFRKWQIVQENIWASMLMGVKRFIAQAKMAFIHFEKWMKMQWGNISHGTANLMKKAWAKIRQSAEEYKRTEEKMADMEKRRKKKAMDAYLKDSKRYQHLKRLVDAYTAAINKAMKGETGFADDESLYKLKKEAEKIGKQLEKVLKPEIDMTGAFDDVMKQLQKGFEISMDSGANAVTKSAEALEEASGKFYSRIFSASLFWEDMLEAAMVIPEAKGGKDTGAENKRKKDEAEVAFADKQLKIANQLAVWMKTLPAVEKLIRRMDVKDFREAMAEAWKDKFPSLTKDELLKSFSQVFQTRFEMLMGSDVWKSQYQLKRSFTELLEGFSLTSGIFKENGPPSSVRGEMPSPLRESYGGTTDPSTIQIETNTRKSSNCLSAIRGGIDTLVSFARSDGGIWLTK
jgi:TP901 family phage tail tape measure protein